MDSMYFGDEDPILAVLARNVHHKPVDIQPKNTQQDHGQVLLFDECSNSFSYSDGGGTADIPSSIIISPMVTVQHPAGEKVL